MNNFLVHDLFNLVVYSFRGSTYLCNVVHSDLLLSSEGIDSKCSVQLLVSLQFTIGCDRYAVDFGRHQYYCFADTGSIIICIIMGQISTSLCISQLLHLCVPTLFLLICCKSCVLDYDRIIKNIERGEARISRKDEIMKAIGKKLDRYRNPWLELKIQYGQNKGKLYNEECDRFMVKFASLFPLL